MIKTRYLAGTVLGSALMVGAVALPTAAFAQDAAPAAATPAGAATSTDTQAQDDQAGDAIVVTGTLFRRTNTETPSPVTVLSAEALQQRGVNTVTQALQTLSSNNAGTIPNAWNAGGSNFASGASSISLRGLNSSYTLVLFDGMRSAFYPYADDGSRNFVDTNTIPEGIVDRIEVLRDGASSTYGADAVAGVVNIITKKQITGLHLNGSAGISQRGDAGEQRIDGTWGFGELDSQGYNFYVAAEYQHNDPLFARDRGYPFNSADQSHICAPSNGQGTVAAGATTCRTNGIANGIQYNGTYAGQQATIVPIVRPYVAPAAGANPLLGATTPVAGSRYQFLNPSAGCGRLTSIALTAAQMTNAGGNAGAVAAPVQCQQDLTNDYLALEPELQRIGASARLTVALGDNAQLYAEGNFYQAKEHTSAANYATNSNGFRTAAGGNQVVLNTITLPVYVCPQRVNCDATNGTLNPNNPFAAAGNVARILWRLPYEEQVDVRSSTYRGALGVTGTFGDGAWQYSLDGTYSHIDNLLTYHNVVWVQHFLDVVADGTFNFVNPSANSQQMLNYIMPTDSTPSSSEVDQVQASLSHSFFDLPGGPLQVGIGGAVRYEADNWNSSNPPDPSNPGARYVALINGVGATGHRWVESGYFEINAPIVKQFEINASGRYDHYSSGQSAFSPKIGAKFTPIQQIAFRGTFSKGFRIPSFNEAYGLPTTGYVGGQVTAATPGSAAYFAAHGSDAYSTGPYTYGLTTSGNPNLQPEKSRNITAGVIVQPVRWLSFTADYYNIRIKNLITPADSSGVIAAYYGNNGVVNIPGVTVIPGTPDVNFPAALPQIGFIVSSFQNANYSQTSGLDFSAEARIPLFDGIRLTSTLEATRLLRLEQSIGGTIQRFEGTLSPCNITSCSGAPKWRGSWQNTLDFAGAGSLSATVYYTSGYDEASIDFGGVAGDCIASEGASVATYRDTSTPVLCRAKSFITTDLTGSIKVGDHFMLYANVINLLDRKPDYDPGAAYGITNYNPAWQQTAFIGRFIRVGARVDF